ncbi:PREDICTED: zinc finger protein 675-like [Papilio polytes]|uniref:zinc finger protein 675-like n=1 Tax=Papilio polytes TaxID=76194 RepID=UPI0006765697|nr:PREDICTED: zinc finger protein 675-like [Papilio polytes]
MNSNINTRYGGICEGCLSMDRKLTAIADAMYLKFYSDLLEKNHISACLLCWECTANVRKMATFRQQVKKAHNTLFDHLMTSTDLTPLTRLSIHQIDPLNINIENPLMDTMDTEVEPMTFVKLENSQNVEDFQLNATFNNEEYMDMTDLTDPFMSKENFNITDEEPLKKKKKTTKKATNNTKKTKTKTERKQTKDLEDKDMSRGQITRYTMHSVKTLKKLNMADNEYMQLVVLTWEEVEEERQKALESDSFKKMLYRCYDCVLGFNHKFKLDNHMKKHDPEYGPEVCDVCKIRCKQASALAAHKKRHQVKWRCALCGARCSRASVAADHVSRAHRAASPTHHCSLCAHHFPTLNKLRLHMKQHSERVKCDQCDKTFVDRSALKNHLFIHSGQKEFRCPHPQCDKRFLFKRAMELHRATHDPHSSIYCHTCDLSFKNEMSYKQHMLYSLKHVDPARLKYACGQCDKKFVKRKRLEEHHVAVHLKTTPVKCTESGCNFACSSRPVLRTHKRMVHRDVRARRDHVCHLCGKAYTSKSALAGHLRAHSGERPLRCARCPAAFGYPAALHNHARRHHPAPAPAHAAGRSKTNEVSQTVTTATLAPLATENTDTSAMWPLTTDDIPQQANETLTS